MSDHSRRFGGVARIYSEAGLQAFTRSHVMVIGLGGVGSWVVEALSRSAIGELTLVDMDHVAESNINRQLQATTENLGRHKGEALKMRIHDINPDCRVHVIDDFINPENMQTLLSANKPLWVVDCIDNFRTKAALIAWCRRNRQKILTAGGAGGMIDPGKINIVDLSKSQQDPLLAKTRKLLRQDYHFPTNPSRSFGIPCVYSNEALRYPDEKGNITPQKPKGAAASGLNCAGGFGSAVCVTASFGFFAAAHVLKKIVDISTPER